MNKNHSIRMAEPNCASIYDHTPGVLYSLSVEPHDQFRFISANQKFLSVVGLSEEKVIGKLVEEVVPPESIQLVRAKYREAIKSKKEVQWEETSEFPNGKKHGIVCICPVLDKNNEVKFLAGIVHDITERKKIALEREQYYRFFQTSSDLMCIAEPNGAFRITNPAFSESLGYSEAELISKPFIDFVHPDDKQETMNEMERQQKVGFSRNFENRYLCKDGSVRWLSWRANFDPVAGVTFASARDITERKAFEAALINAKHEAENAAKSKSTFLDIAAHELRTPITVLSSLLQLAQRTVAKEQPLKIDLLSSLREPTDQLARLVVDLLDVSRLERGLMVMQVVRTDLSSLISRSVLEFQTLDPQRKITFFKPQQDIELELDPVRIKQVLSNLLDNALKYTKPETTIEVRLEQKDDAIRVSVIDQGAGISRDQQKKIFSAFSRGDSEATTRTTGLGLGLSVCQGIIKMHGGIIGVTSDLDKGSTFFFELPRSKKT